MTEEALERERECQFFARAIEPLVRELLKLDDPWDAYERANLICGLMTDTSPGGSFSLCHAGGVYVAWAELAELFETGKTPISDAHATLMASAERWLTRPAEPTADFVEQWMAEVSEAVETLFRRDGNWWIAPE